jgi:tRNA (cmo5U34)-methyltransferase
MPDRPEQATPKDRVFTEQRLPGDFVFDDKVAQVFEDMINRSVPGYSTIVGMIGLLAERYCQPGSRVYDLGCSLGGASFSIAQHVTRHDYEIVAVDNSAAMIERMQQRVDGGQFAHRRISCQLEDVLQTPISDASVVVLNFTLQFIPPEQRQQLIEQIYSGMRPDGILIISEKILFPDTKLNELFIDLYHGFKESMGYSKLEISQKRTALENVLIPETLESHRKRLASAGFQSVDVWFQCFNFASMVAFK